jgi:putative transposase
MRLSATPVSSQWHRKLVKTFNEEGHAHFLTFSCFQRMQLLTNDLWRGWLAQAILASNRKHNVALWAYVFMPEHIHLLVRPRCQTYNISGYRHDLKQSLSKRVINALREANSSLLGRLRVQERPGKVCHRFWQEGPGYDKNIWSTDKAVEKARYCHWNPVKRGLVSEPEGWKWSSYRWLETGQREGEPLALDEWAE